MALTHNVTILNVAGVFYRAFLTLLEALTSFLGLAFN